MSHKPSYFLTAYGIARKHGYEGTEEEWLDSLTAYGVACRNGFPGTVNDWLDSLTAYALAQQAGFAGTIEAWIQLLSNPVPAIEIGEVTTLSPGSRATVAISGDAKHPKLHFGIPEGVGVDNALPLNGSKPMTGNLNMGGNRITGMAAPADKSDAATKQYVDGVKSTAESALSKANEAQPALGFVPVQQGFLDGTGTNKLRFGWRSLPNGRGTLGVFVDGIDIGNIPMSNPNFGGCTPIENGGTGAVTRTDALKNFDGTGGTPKHLHMCYEYLHDTGLASVPTTTASVIENMSFSQSCTFTQHVDRAAYLVDLPFSYGVVTLRKGVAGSYCDGDAVDIVYGKRYCLERRSDGTMAWRRVMTNVLTTDDYGTTFPANAVTGQMYYLKG